MPKKIEPQKKLLKTFASDNNPLFIVVPRQDNDHSIVREVQIRQGRANEFYMGKAMFASLGKPILRLKYKDSNTDGEPDTINAIVSKLQTFVVSESKSFLITDQGRDELMKIAEFVFNFSVIQTTLRM